MKKTRTGQYIINVTAAIKTFVWWQTEILNNEYEASKISNELKGLKGRSTDNSAGKKSQ